MYRQTGRKTDLTGASASRQSSIPLVRHRGICADAGCRNLIDSMPPGGARWVPFPIFADGYNVTIDSLAPTPSEAQQRVARVIPFVDQLPYQPAATCDHLATYAETGQWMSPQAVVFILAGLTGIALWAHYHRSGL
jgi:hypothetical protein